MHVHEVPKRICRQQQCRSSRIQSLNLLSTISYSSGGVSTYRFTFWYMILFGRYPCELASLLGDSGRRCGVGLVGRHAWTRCKYAVEWLHRQEAGRWWRQEKLTWRVRCIEDGGCSVGYKSGQTCLEEGRDVLGGLQGGSGNARPGPSLTHQRRANAVFRASSHTALTIGAVEFVS